METPAGELRPTDRCAVHPDRAAAGPCARCGTFVCPSCARDGGAVGRLCAPCDARVGETPVAWELRDPDVVRSYYRTFRAILRTPSTFFARLPDGLLLDAYLFFAIAAAPLLVTSILLTQWRGRMLNAVCGGACSIAIAPLFPIVYGTVVHLLAKTVGATGSPNGTVRASLYSAASAMAWMYPAALLESLGAMPVAIGKLELAVFALGTLLAARSVALYLRARRGVPRRAAWFAPLLLAIAFLATITVPYLFLQFAPHHGRAVRSDAGGVTPGLATGRNREGPG